MSTNKSREILACRRQVLSREQREGERQRARVNTRGASEDDRQRERVRSRRRRQNFSEESRLVERVRARRSRENSSEERRQAEQDRARMNRQRQRERGIQRQRERQQNNDMMTESVVFDSEDEYRTGCRNVSDCQQQQSNSGLRSPRRSNSTYFRK